MVETGEGLSIAITHHFVDRGEYPEGKILLEKAKELGIDVVRTHPRWKVIIPEPGQVNREYLVRYVDYAKQAQDLGMENYIILSDPPERAIEKAKENPKAVLDEYHLYLETLKQALEEKGVKATMFQIFNELNTAYTPKVFIEQLPAYCQAVRDIFGPEVELSITLATADLLRLAEHFPGSKFQTFANFLREHEGVLKSCKLDSLGINFYPGLYNLPKKVLYKDMAKDLEELKKSIILASELLEKKVKIEVAEVGFPLAFENLRSGLKNFGRLQRWAYDNFARAFVQMIHELQEEHQISISGLAFYQLGIHKEIEPVLKFGLYNDQGEARGVTGSHKKAGRQNPQTEASDSQLAFIIRYLKKFSSQ